MNISDVAVEAGVSVATVSRVLNQNGYVSEAAEKSVRSAIERLGYVPNISARNFRKQESRVILIVAPNFTNPYYSHILSGITETSRTAGYSAMIFSGKTSNKEDILAEMVVGNKADGAILLTCNLDDTWIMKYADKLPIVQCSEAVENSTIPYIAIDNYAAMKDSINYIQSLGHKRIGFITVKNLWISTKLRKQSYMDEMKKIGVSTKGLIREVNDYSFENGRLAAIDLIMQAHPTAIACSSDVLALGAIAAAGEMGLSVPKDLSIIGFDDVDYTKMFHPYLTTIAQPCYELGKTSVEELIKCIQAKKNLSDKIVLNHKLKIRETTMLLG
ncbi:MAG: LacI family transcriptional regulator [Lachnospiraceae bacterium]|nr:LacI family transcriptional regulator [Lachnospiraceae bacterium]